MTHTVRSLLACALLPAAAGCSTRDERLYRRAETLFNQNSYQLAAEAYDEVLERAPGSPFADDALYKVAFIRRVYLEDPRGAIDAYRRLVEEYGESQYADEALMHVGAIYVRQLQDPVAAAAVYREAVERFRKKPPSAARAQLALAALLYRQGKPEAADAVRVVLTDYPDLRREGARAQLLLAQVMHHIANDPEAAVAEYQKVLDNYADTREAAEAKQAIGLLYYGIKEEEDKRPKPRWEQPAKRLGDVPPYDEASVPFAARLLAPLRAALRHHGASYSLAELLAISGAAFQFYYDPADRRAGWTVSADSPVVAACEQLGFSCSSIASDDADAGYMRLRQSIIEGSPVITEYNVPPRRWLLVVGFDNEKQQVSLLPPGAGAPQQVPLATFQSSWAARGETGSGASPALLAQFVVGKRVRTPDATTVAKQALRRGAEHLRGKPALGFEGGAAAYEALLSDLRAHGRELALLPDDASDLAAWGGDPLASLTASRRAAASYLRQVGPVLPEASREAARRGAEELEEAVRLLAQLKQTFPRLREGAPPEDAAQAAVFASSCQTAADMVERILQAERAAERQLSAALP